MSRSRGIFMTSEEIKAILRMKKIAYWKLADEIGVCDNSIIRWLRREQPQHEKEIIEAIETLTNEKRKEEHNLC